MPIIEQLQDPMSKTMTSHQYLVGCKKTPNMQKASDGTMYWTEGSCRPDGASIPQRGVSSWLSTDTLFSWLSDFLHSAKTQAELAAWAAPRATELERGGAQVSPPLLKWYLPAQLSDDQLTQSTQSQAWRQQMLGKLGLNEGVPSEAVSWGLGLAAVPPARLAGLVISPTRLCGPGEEHL